MDYESIHSLGKLLETFTLLVTIGSSFQAKLAKWTPKWIPFVRKKTFKEYQDYIARCQKAEIELLKDITERLNTIYENDCLQNQINKQFVKKLGLSDTKATE